MASSVEFFDRLECPTENTIETVCHLAHHRNPFCYFYSSLFYVHDILWPYALLRHNNNISSHGTFFLPAGIVLFTLRDAFAKCSISSVLRIDFRVPSQALDLIDKRSRKLLPRVDFLLNDTYESDDRLVFVMAF